MSTIDPSTIDPTKPTQGEAFTADVRANELATQQQLQNAKNDIEALEGQSGGHVIENDGTPLTDRTALNFGTGLIASDNAGADSTDVVLDTGTTDGLYAPLGHVGATGAAHGPATGIVDGFMSSGDKSKLDGIPSDAASGDMLQSVYDADADGIVDDAERISATVVNNSGATIVKGSFVTGSPGTPPSITLADGASDIWAEGVTAEDITNGSTGLVILSGGLVGVNTVGAAVGDAIYLGSAGTWTITQPLTKDWQRLGRVFNVDAANGSITVNIEAPVTPEAEGSTGVLVLTEASGTLPHVNASLTTWTEIVPGASESAVFQLINMGAGSNPGRLAFDYSGTTGPQPVAGSIGGTVVVHASVEFAGADDFLEVAPAKNGAIIFAELAGYAGIGGNQTTGTAIPVTMSFPIGGWSDGDELSIVTRGSVATFIIHSMSVSFMSADGAGGGGGGGATPDHNTLPGRGAVDAHPQTAITGLTAALDAKAPQTSLDAHINDTSAAHASSAVSVTPVGGLGATDAQSAFAELDSDLSGHVGAATGAHAASAIAVTPAGGISSTNTQAALQEIDSGLTSHIGSGGAAHADATGVADGFMTAAQFTKLAGIEDSANNYSHPNHSGDVVSVGDGAQTIQPGVVSNSKLANMAGFSLKLRTSSSPGSPEDVTLASLTPNASGTGLLFGSGPLGTGFGSVDIASLAGGSSPLTTKGDVYTYSTTDARLPVGADGLVLEADSAEPTGLKWGTKSASGGGDVTGPAGVASANALAIYADTSGKVIADGTIVVSDVVTQATAFASTGLIPVSDGTAKALQPSTYTIASLLSEAETQITSVTPATINANEASVDMAKVGGALQKRKISGDLASGMEITSNVNAITFKVVSPVLFSSAGDVIDSTVGYAATNRDVAGAAVTPAPVGGQLLTLTDSDPVIAAPSTDGVVTYIIPSAVNSVDLTAYTTVKGSRGSGVDSVLQTWKAGARLFAVWSD